MPGFQSAIWVTVGLPSIRNACISYSIASLLDASVCSDIWLLLLYGFSCPWMVSVVHGCIQHLQSLMHPVVAICCCNLENTQQKMHVLGILLLSYLSIFWLCTARLSTCHISLFQMDKHGIQLYRIEVSVNNTTLTSYSVYCVVAVLRHWTQLLEIRLYSWKPLFLIVPDRNIIFLANECR